MENIKTLNVEGNNFTFCEEDEIFLNINLSGTGNTIKIGKLSNGCKSKINMNLFCDNSTIIIGDNLSVNNNFIMIIGNNHPNFGKVENFSLHIGENVSIESILIHTVNSHAKIKIGNNCMIAEEVTIYDTDGHPVFDLETGEIINKVKELHIGNHCWIGRKSTILKNSFIADDCIVGYGAIVAGKFLDEHCAIAGNPARVVKKNITWDSCSNNGYVQNEIVDKLTN